jgi:hypothetical protein
MVTRSRVPPDTPNDRIVRTYVRTWKIGRSQRSRNDLSGCVELLLDPSCACVTQNPRHSCCLLGKTRRAIKTLPRVDQPTDIKRIYNAVAPDIREASLRQTSDFSKVIYQAWKDDLNADGLTWQTFLFAASSNRDAWCGWLDDMATWAKPSKRL